MARSGQDLINEVRADLDEPYEANWSNTNLLMWLNKGIVELVSATRSQREHWFDQVINSTDSQSTIYGESYTPSTALKPTINQSTLTLPPNCIEVVSILPLSQTDLDNGVQFVLSKPSSSEFQYFQRGATPSYVSTYFYYTYGKRTLHVAPAFAATFDIRLQYVGMPDEITLSSSPSTIAEWMLDLAVLYARYRALNAINHPDANSALATYENKEKRMMALNRPRSSGDPVLTESAFDGYDAWDDYF